MVKLRFGPRVKKARVKLDITQAELGKKLDPQVSPATISLWENEKSTPSSEQKLQVEKILGKNPNEIDAKNLGTKEENEGVVEAPSAIGAWLNKSRTSAIPSFRVSKFRRE